VDDDIVRRTLTPEQRGSAEVLYTHKTSIRDAIWRCNAFSQNLFAEALIKALAAYEPDLRKTGVAGSWPAGGERLTQR
jgi:glucose-6-phosphate isomerase